VAYSRCYLIIMNVLLLINADAVKRTEANPRRKRSPFDYRKEESLGELYVPGS
jgi:hypothetical protein